MEELIKSIKASLYDRLANPFLGSFLISWLIINWQIPYILFIDDDSLSLIERVIIVNSQHVTVGTFLFPVLLSILYTFAYPFFTKEVLKFTTRRRNEQSETVDIESGKRMVSIEEQMKFHQEKIELERKIESLYEEKNKIIETLSKENLSLNNEVTHLNEVIKFNNDRAEKEKSDSGSLLAKELFSLRGENKIIKETAMENLDKKNKEIEALVAFKNNIIEMVAMKTNENDKYNYQQLHLLKNDPLSRYSDVAERILMRKELSETQNMDVIEFLNNHNLITKSENNKYEFTPSGKTLLKYHLENSH